MEITSTHNDPASLAGKIELLILKQDVTPRELRLFCVNIQDHPLAAVLVHGSQVAAMRHALEDGSIKVGALVGFPLGLNDSDVKRYEAEAAVDNGAHQIAVVAHVGWVKERLWDPFLRELRDIVDASDERPVTVILESNLLTLAQISEACECILDSGAQYVQASAGFLTPLPGNEVVPCIREAVGPQFGVKVAGPILDSRTALDYIRFGANKIVTSANLFPDNQNAPWHDKSTGL